MCACVHDAPPGLTLAPIGRQPCLSPLGHAEGGHPSGPLTATVPPCAPPPMVHTKLRCTCALRPSAVAPGWRWSARGVTVAVAASPSSSGCCGVVVAVAGQCPATTAGHREATAAAGDEVVVVIEAPCGVVGSWVTPPGQLLDPALTRGEGDVCLRWGVAKCKPWKKRGACMAVGMSPQTTPQLLMAHVCWEWGQPQAGGTQHRALGGGGVGQQPSFSLFSA